MPTQRKTPGAQAFATPFGAGLAGAGAATAAGGVAGATAFAGGNAAILQALVSALLAGAAGGAGIAVIVGLIAALKPPVTHSTAVWLATLTYGVTLDEELGIEPGPAQAIEQDAAAAWLALYIVAAERRLADATTVTKARAAEERYFELHLAAERRRLRAALLVDAAHRAMSDRSPDGLLGWRSVIDGRTTPECAFANQRNFVADQMPIIGWPGAVHLNCRCSAGPPIPGAPLIPSA